MTTFQLSFSGITIPWELFHQIGDHLTLKDLATCFRVCKAWHHFLQSDPFWKPLCERDFSLISQQKTGYPALYRWFHQLQSSLLINPQPITLKGLKSHNPQLICIYTGKSGTLPQFTPLAEIGDGKAIKNLYKKVSKKPQKTEKWVGKIGDPMVFVLRNDPRTLRTREKAEMDIDSLREKLASDLYQELGRGLFIVPKTRISSQPIVNTFTQSHGLIPPWISKYSDCLRIMSYFMPGYQNLSHARVMKNVSLLEFIQAHHCFPATILTEDGVSVPLLGLSSILSLDQILTQENLPENIGWIWIRDQNHGIVKAQTIKVESSSNSIVGLQDLSQIRTIENSTFRSFVNTHRRFPDKILTPQGHPVILRGKNQLPQENPDNPKILELTEGRFGFLWIEETYQGKSYIESAQIIKIDLSTKAIEGFHKLSQARHDLSFLDYMELYHRPPEAILNPKDYLVPLKGMMGLLAVARILGDVDVIGGGGGNAGFQWEEDASHNIIGAQVVKIDPGCCFSFIEDLLLYNWTLKKQKGLSVFPPDFRDLQPATQKEDLLIQWNALSSLQKQEFLVTLLNTTRYLKSPQVFEFLFHREGRWTRSELESLPDYFLEEKQTQLRRWTDEQLAIYKDDLETFQRQHPEHLLRIYYLDQCGELSLPMTEETFPIRELYTQLKIVQEEEEPSSPHGLGRPEALLAEEAREEEKMLPFSKGSKTLELVDLFPPSKTPRRVLLLGKAGIGKSTLCQKIAHDWSLGELWKERFEVVYWIPLREFNAKMAALALPNSTSPPLSTKGSASSVTTHGKSQDSSSNPAILGRILSLLVFQQTLSEKELLTMIQKHGQGSLWILDGYDEATPELQAWIAQLLQDQNLNLLITSRPGMTEGLSSLVDLQFENVGFSDAQVETYIQQFYSRKVTPTDPQPFLKMLKNQSQLWDLAHIPLQLQMLCSLGEQNKEALTSQMTKLYEQMVAEMLRWNQKKIGSYKPEELLLALGQVAEVGLKSRQLVIPRQIIEEALKSGSVPLEALVATGLIRESPDKTTAVFLHLSFQEYAAALFLATLADEELKTWIRASRDDPSYHLMLTFLSGVLASKDLQKGELIFEALAGDESTWTLDQQKWRLRLCLKCLNEALGDFSLNQGFSSLDGALSHHLTVVERIFEEEHALYHLTPVLKYLYTKQPSLLKKTNARGHSPLISICSIGNLALAQWLWEKDLTLLRKFNEDGWTPLHAAARGGHREIFQWLLEKEPTLLRKFTNYGFTPLHAAVRGGNWEIMQWLWEKDGALLRKFTRSRWTPLHEAAQRGDLKVVKWLSEKEPTLLRQFTINDGWTSLDYAAKGGHWETVKWLSEKEPTLLRQFTNDGWTPLHEAAQRGDLEIVKWMWEKEPMLLHKFRTDGWTPLHEAAKGGHWEMVKWMWEKEPTLLRKFRTDGWTPLHGAVRRGDLEIVKWMWEKEPTLLRQFKKDCWTPLHIAAYLGDLEMVQWLCQQNSQQAVARTKYHNKTPFHIAKREGKTEVADWLAEHYPEGCKEEKPCIIS